MIDPIQFFKCLSDETRLHSILLIHSEGELCVCELMQALSDSQPKISRHLAQLRGCGVLDDSRRGQWVFYSLAKNLPQWAKDVLDACAQNPQSSEVIQQFKRKLEAMDNRPACC